MNGFEDYSEGFEEVLSHNSYDQEEEIDHRIHSFSKDERMKREIQITVTMSPESMMRAKKMIVM